MKHPDRDRFEQQGQGIGIALFLVVIALAALFLFEPMTYRLGHEWTQIIGIAAGLPLLPAMMFWFPQRYAKIMTALKCKRRGHRMAPHGHPLPDYLECTCCGLSVEVPPDFKPR